MTGRQKTATVKRGNQKQKAMKKLIVTVTHKLVILANEDVNLEDVMNEMEVTFKDTTDTVTIEDSSMEDFTTQDSK